MEFDWFSQGFCGVWEAGGADVLERSVQEFPGLPWIPTIPKVLVVLGGFSLFGVFQGFPKVLDPGGSKILERRIRNVPVLLQIPKTPVFPKPWWSHLKGLCLFGVFPRFSWSLGDGRIQSIGKEQPGILWIPKTLVFPRLWIRKFPVLPKPRWFCLWGFVCLGFSRSLGSRVGSK